MGAYIMVLHQRTLYYLKQNQKKLMFGLKMCATCTRLKSAPDVGTSAQIKFVEYYPKHRRNRLRIGANFTATLPNVVDAVVVDDIEGDGDESTSSQLLATPRPLAPATPDATSEAATSTPSTSATPTSTPTAESNSNQEQELPTGKLQKVLADLKVASLPISEEMRKKLVQVVSDSLDAFAASATDLGRTSVVVHRIKTTGEAKPVRHKLRAIPYARRQFLEQKSRNCLQSMQ